MSYTKYHDAWEDLPSEETPITADALDHIEQGIYDAADAADTAQTDVDALEETVGDIQTSVSTLTSTVSGIQTDVDTLEESVSDLEDEVADITDIRTTVTGNPITITATAMQNLAECEIEIVAQQDGTPSTSSPVEITGMSEVTVSNAESGIDYTFSIGSTCYGGTLNTKTGVLTVTHAIVDLGTLSWYQATTVNGYYRFTSASISSLISPPTSSSAVADILCSSYEAIAYNSAYNEIQGVGVNTGGNIVVYDADLNGYTAADFKTAMSGIYLCYPLATPTTTTLTGQEIALISGENNLSTDADSITAVYQSAPDIYLAIGDSLETGYLTDSTTTTGWGELLPQYFKEKSVFCSGVNGSAFCSSDSSRSTTVTSFLEQLEAMVDDMTDTEKGLVKKVIVGGGFNDIEFTSSEDTIISYITEFCDYVRANLPKAEILVLITGWATDYSRRIAMGEIKRIYKEACSQNGAAFIDVSFASHKYDHFYSDGVHLLEDGQIALAECMANAIRTGYGAVFYPLTTMSITANETWCTSAGSLAMSISDDNVTLHLYGQDLFFVDSASFDVNTWCSIGTLPENTFIWGADSSGNNMSFMVNGWICSDGSYYDFMGYMTIVDKLVYIKHTMVAADNTGLRSFSNVTELSIYPTTVSFPLSES